MLRRVSDFIIIFVCVMGLSACQSELPATTAICAELTSLTLPNTTITLAEDVAPGAFSPPAGGADGFQDLPAFCRVAVTLTPSADSNIKVEVWLPTEGWNGNYQPTGNGGWAGSIGFGRMSDVLADGYATSGTDTGHEGFTSEFMMGNPELLTDFSYRAFHEMVETSKAVIGEYYGDGPTLSVMNQAGGAGRQAILMAQLYPNDLDAIAVPGTLDLWKTRYHFAQMATFQSVHRSSESPISEEKRAMVHEATLGACDALVDGSVDGLIEDPRSCDFDPGVLLCQGPDGPDCLTTAQVETARSMYRPVIHASTGEVITTHYLRGSELNWDSPEETPATINALEFFKAAVFEDRSWDHLARPINFDTDFERANRPEMIEALNATEADLGAFMGRGGKILIVGGWADASTTWSGSVDYYEAVVAEMGEYARDGIRLFMIPGMGHIMSPRGSMGFNFDSLGVLLDWKETGTAPDQVVVNRYADGTEVGTRLVCAYPQTARYQGAGDVNDAANFSCVSPE